MSKEQRVIKAKANDIDKLVGKRLKMRRIFLGLNQLELAKIVNVTTLANTKIRERY